MIRLGAFGLCLTIALGCRVFEESLLEADAGYDAGPRDAGPRDARDASELDAGRPDAGPACPLIRPPPRPDVADGPSIGEIVYALEGIDLDQGDEWATTGYDLDGLCTLPEAPTIECLAPAASATAEIDGEGGIDNAFGHQVLPLLLLARPDLAETTARDQHVGISTFILRIRGWNGTDDDPLVEVAFAPSEFGTPGLADGGRPDPGIPDGSIPVYGDGGVPEPPKWMGNDYWWLRDESFAGGDLEMPRMRDDQAWVARGVLVMRIPSREPIILTGGFRSTIFKFSDGVLTAELSEDRTRVERAVIAGRWSVSDMLETAEAGNICRGTDDYRSLARLLDLAADVRAAPGTGGPTATCDAVSVGLSFHGVKAKIGGVSGLLGVPNACRDAMDAGVDGG